MKAQVEAVRIRIGEDGQTVQGCVSSSKEVGHGKDMPVLREVSIGEIGENGEGV